QGALEDVVGGGTGLAPGVHSGHRVARRVVAVAGGAAQRVGDHVGIADSVVVRVDRGVVVRVDLLGQVTELVVGVPRGVVVRVRGDGALGIGDRDEVPVLVVDEAPVPALGRGLVGQVRDMAAEF